MISSGRFMTLVLFTVSFAGCAPETTAQVRIPSAVTVQIEPYSPPKSYSLGIAGYNYTDRYIDHFEVNGQGGGNVSISTPTAGGGKGVCCVSWTEGSKLPKPIKVKWAASYCTQVLTGGYNGETQTVRQPILHIAEVEFNGPVPKNPKNFEVHFYKDGSIQTAITDESSWPRLKLPAGDGYARPGSVRTDPVCPADYNRLKAFNNPIRVDATPRTQP